MADKTITGAFGDIKYHDNGDGTYSEVIYTGASGGGGGGAVTVADGADVTEGAIADASVAAGAAGTVSAKLRRITTDIDAVKTNTTGLATAANQTTAASTLSTIATNTGNGATAASQTTANNSLSSIDGKIPAAPATAGNQTTANTSLSTIATNTGNNATSANQTNGNQQTKLTDGTNIANVIAADTGFNGVGTTSATKTITFTTSTPGAQVLLANTDVRGYSWIEVVYTSVGTGLALTGQFTTASSGTYVNSSTFGSSANGVGGGLGNAVNIIYFSPIHGNFFQLNLTALTSGTVSGTVTLRAIPPANNTITANQTGTWTVGSNSATGSAVPANAFYQGVSDGTNLRGVLGAANALNSTGTGIPAAQLVAQLDETAPTVITENQFGNLRMSPRRALLIQSEDRNSLTYSASTNVTLAAAATDFFTITGNASTTVYVTKMRISGQQTTGGMVTVAAVKRSTADTGGTSGAVTAIPHDSSDAAASATLLAYTANPTTGTAVGTLRQDSMPFASATATTNNIVEWTFGQNGRPIVLRGTTQQLALNLAGLTVTGGAVNVDIEWFEV